MATTMTVKGQVTIPKKVRDALNLGAGSKIEFDVSQQGQVVLHKVEEKHGGRTDRFDAVRGTAQVKWRTDDLMALLRGNG